MATPVPSSFRAPGTHDGQSWKPLGWIENRAGVRIYVLTRAGDVIAAVTARTSEGFYHLTTESGARFDWSTLVGYRERS